MLWLLVRFIKLVMSLILWLEVITIIWDKLSFFIVSEILREKEISTWEIAKKYAWEDKNERMDSRQKDRYFSVKSNFIKSRLKKMSEEGFVSSENNIFIIDRNKVLLKKHKFPCGIRQALIVLDKSKKWNIYEL